MDTQWNETHARYLNGFEMIERNFFKSRSLSIDSWLAKETNSDCVDAAKLLIAHFISQREHGNFTPDGFFLRQYRGQNRTPDWYRLLFNALSTDNFADFPASGNRLTIVTFNYDRSLEFYLLEAMQGMYQRYSKKDCWKKLQALNIKHVYGHIGDLPVANPERGVQYGSDLILDYRKRIENLKLIPEFRNKTNEGIDFIRGKLKEAQNTFFIGFSYDSLNLKLLGFPFQSKQLNIEFHGSVFGMEEADG